MEELEGYARECERKAAWMTMLAYYNSETDRADGLTGEAAMWLTAANLARGVYRG